MAGSPGSPPRVASPRSPKSHKSSSGKASAPQSPSGQSTGSTGDQAGAETENALIAVDEEVDESYDLDNASSSASITSSILRYRFENGRRYHAYKDGAYIAPNDDIENERLDLQHHMFRHLSFNGEHHICPAKPEKMHRVLDVGTGTGIWSIDFADDHPNVEVIGIDLSPPPASFVPPNVRFYVDDVNDPWTYNEPFDLIYSRAMSGSIADFPAFFAQSYDNLAPSGWIEMVDVVFPLECEDATMTKDSAVYRWSQLFLEGMTKMGKPVNSALQYDTQLAEAGFTNIVKQKYRWPINRWPKDENYKELGTFMYENVGKNLSGISLALFTRVLGWSQTQVEVFLIDVRKEFKDPKIHAYAPIWVTYGQKPAEA